MANNFAPFFTLLGSFFSISVGLLIILPTYYIADGAANAVSNTNAFPATLVDVSLTVGVTIALALLSLWTLASPPLANINHTPCSARNLLNAIGVNPKSRSTE